MRLLDLYCGAGGCTRGYQAAGFEVTGVDLRPQPNYCGDHFVQADALEFLAAGGARGFDAAHASAPCQGYLRGVMHRPEVPLLIAPTRALLEASGLPYVIENVVSARPHLRDPVLLCGSSFGLRVWRHRLFETSFPVWLWPPCSHAQHPRPLDVTGSGGAQRAERTTWPGGRSRKPANLAAARAALGIDWMSRPELAEAVPPAMTEWLGGRLLDALERRAAA